MLVGSEVDVVACCKCVLHQGLAITVAKVRVPRDFHRAWHFTITSMFPHQYKDRHYDFTTFLDCWGCIFVRVIIGKCNNYFEYESVAWSSDSNPQG